MIDMDKDKDVVFRVTGIPEAQCSVELQKWISELLSYEERRDIQQNIAVTLAPSCYGQDRKWTALITFPRVPQTLQKHEDWQMPVTGGYLNFDHHFHGFTPLYSPAEAEGEIIAE